MIVHKYKFREVISSIENKYINGPYTSELNKNHRSPPFQPMTILEPRSKPYFPKLKETKFSTLTNLCDDIYCGGPVVVVVQNNPLVPHAIVLKGFDTSLRELLVHDPWRGRNRGVGYG